MSVSCRAVIKRQPGRAAYRLVADELRAQITAGELAMGDELPSRDALMRVYDIGKETATKALALLKAEGLIETAHGRRARVATPQVRVPIWLEPGALATSRVPTADEAERLEISELVPVLVVEVVGRAPVLYPADRFELRVPSK